MCHGVCVYMCVHMHVHMCVCECVGGDNRDWQKSVLSSTMWALGIKLKPSAAATSPSQGSFAYSAVPFPLVSSCLPFSNFEEVQPRLVSLKSR